MAAARRRVDLSRPQIADVWARSGIRCVLLGVLTVGAVVGWTPSTVQGQLQTLTNWPGDTAVAQLPPSPSLAAPTAPVASSEVYRLTLEDAKQLAMANNSQLQLGRLNVKAKQIAIRVAQSDFLPKILGSVDYLHFDQPLGQISTPGVLFAPITANVFNKNSSFGTIMGAQPITQLIGVSALVDIARADANVAAAKLDQGTIELMSGITQAYYGLVAAQRIEMALTLQVQAIEPLLKQKPNATLRLGLLEIRNGLAQTVKQVGELTDTLDQLTGLAPGTQLELAEPALPGVPVASAEEAAAFAMVNNPQISEAQQNICKAHAGIKAARMDYLPIVDVVGGYANQNAADYIQPNFSYVGVTANYTFLDWGKRCCTLRQRETELMMANKNVQVTAETVQLDARKAFLAFKEAESQVQIAKEVVAANLDGVKEAKGLPAVLTAKSDFAKAQLDQMKAELAFRLAQIKLLAAIGQR
jgi:outer membrane protein TolC